MRLRAGDRAVVTGASSGIGEALARELASRGVQLILVSRDEDRLKALAAELSDRTRCSVIPCDLRLRIPEADELGHVDLLVNNAGFGATGRFEANSPEWVSGMIDLNVRAPAALTRELVPAMLQQGRGGILNVASSAAFQPLPFMAEYAATKAFVLNFSRALHVEYAALGVTVTALCPGNTRTRFHEVSGSPSRMAGTLQQSAKVVARAGIMGLEAGRSTVVSGWYNRVGAALAEITPGWLSAAVAGRALRAITR